MNPDTQPPVKSEELLQITIKSKSIEYSGTPTTRKAHKMLQLIMESEKQDKVSEERLNG